jgi:outer membrane lipoprotein
MKILWCVIVALLLSSCATQVPISISKPTVSNITLAEVLAEPERFTDSNVRWGGVITTVENKATQTWVVVVGQELKKNGKPLEEGHSSGRFIANFEGFADPVVYSTGHLLTVVGTIEGQTTQTITTRFRL